MVIWTVVAQRQLRQALFARAGDSPSPVLEQAMNDLAARLQRLFDQDHVIVQRLFVGFRPRDEGDYTVLVEVHGTDRAESCIVKLGKAETLQKELDAWN